MSEMRALLLTDVVGSTELAETLGDAATAALWSAHDRIARDLLVPWCGREIDKTDGFLLLFADAVDAAAYAIAYHQAINKLQPAIQARAGLHVGAVLLRENSAADVALGAKPLEVEGLAKPIAARVMALARGGQTLATAAAQQQLHAGAGATQYSHSIGHWRLKGVTEPLELFEIGDASTVFTPPADAAKAYRVLHKHGLWLPARDVPHNLPLELTSFIGRERELADVLAALADHRLVTVTGSGGLGKTRLALRVALAALGEFPDGVWFVELAPLRDAAAVPQALAKALGVQAVAGKALVDTLCTHLRQQDCLLVLDNCEHLVEACAALTHSVLSRCAGVRVLATSRESLRLAGEQTVLLAPLPTPDAGTTLSVEQAGGFAAVRLFVERVQLHTPHFDLRAGRLLPVLDICQRLDGAPLALELAAARVRALAVQDLAARLKDRFALLVDRSPAALPRQHSLHALIDWSYGLLEPEEKHLLCALSVFAGGWSLAAAEAVGQDEVFHIERDDVVLILASLVDKSLILADTQNTRYRMLATIREFASDALLASGHARAVRQRHAQHFVALTDEAGPLSTDPQQGPMWMQRLDLEHDNLQLMLAWLVSEQTSAELPLRMCGQLYRFWLTRAHWREGQRWCDAALAMAGEAGDDARRARAQLVAGGMCERLGQPEAGSVYAEAALVLCQRAGDRSIEANVLNLLAIFAQDLGQHERSLALLLRASALNRALGNHRAEAVVLGNYGFTHLAQGHLDAALEPLQRCLALGVELGSRQIIGSAQRNLGLLAFYRQDHVQAKALLLLALATARALGSRANELDALDYLAETELALDDLPAALGHFRDALSAHRKLAYVTSAADCFDALVGLAVAQQAFEHAAVWAGASQALRDGGKGLPMDEPRRDANLARCASELGPAAFESLRAVARTQPIEQSFKEALAWLDELMALDGRLQPSSSRP